MAAPQTEVLITVDGSERGRYMFLPGDYIIGREEGCHIRVEAELVSRKHAKLVLNYDNAFIEDLGSSNGTRVNGQPVIEATRLWPNQKIQVGAATIELRRLKVEVSDQSLMPTQAVVRRVLPEEFLREKKYDIGKVVAQGGMGAILDAKEATIERTVAMKVMLDTADADALARFLNEAKITGQLEHPNIVPVHELGVDENGQPYYTMKMVRGITLKKVLELMAAGTEATLNKYPLPALLTIFQKVCDAIGFAHSRGVIHRDLKPENIMLGDYGEVLVMDWGLAKRMKDTGERRKESESAPQDDIHTIRHTVAAGMAVSATFDPSTLASTLAGTVMGTPQFMSPEQARGEVATLDARSDIYSLGAILFQILTLRVPVTGKDAWDIIAKVTRGEIEPLGEGAPPTHGIANLGRGLPDSSLAAVVRKAMAFDRGARYATVADFQRDVTAYQNGFATGAENASWWKRAALAIKRNQAASIGAAAVLLVGGIFGTKAVVEGRHATAALVRLRGTAPTFYGQAQALIEKQQFAGALEKISYAIELAPGDAGYHFVQGNILESLSRLADARAAYDEALRLDPAHAFARENRDLCAEILAEEKGGGALGKPSLHKLNLLMRREGRTAEAIATLRESAKDRQALMDTWCAVLAKAGLPVGDSHFPYGLMLGDDGLFDLGLNARKIGGKLLDDISFLRGMPLRKLTIDTTNVSVLTPLAGAPLEELNIGPTLVSDLRPLSGMKLMKLKLYGSKVTDLTPLHGMPLRVLNLNHTDVSDLHPLIGMPLEDLDLDQTKVEDITPLHGLKLKRLSMIGLHTLRSIDPLEGMPLVNLSFGVNSVSDLAPLIGMRLESIGFGDTAVTDLRPLKGMPLTTLGAGSTGGKSKLADLTPLQGMKLRTLNVQNSLVKDLSPLRAQPIEEANLARTAIGDFSVLATWPLRTLSVHHTKFKDLQVLAGKRIETLYLSETAVTDISVLRTMPLRELTLHDTQVIDFHPLADIPTLNVLTLPARAKDIEFLRHKPGLQKIGFTSSTSDAPPAEEFWKEYDEWKAAGEK